MDKNKGTTIAIIILAVSILSSAIIIFAGLNAVSNAYNDLKSLKELESKKIVQHEEIMEIKEAAAYLHLSEEYLLKTIKKQEPTIPYFWIEDKYLFSKTALDKWASSQFGIASVTE